LTPLISQQKGGFRGADSGLQQGGTSGLVTLMATCCKPQLAHITTSIAAPAKSSVCLRSVSDRSRAMP